MTGPQTHIIFQQLLEIETSMTSRAEQSALADVWSHLAGAQLPALLERAFDAAVPADELLQIDHLEVVLETGPGESPDAVLARELPGQLARALAAIPKKDRERGTIAQRVGDWAIFYLKNGYLPWTAPAQLTPAELEYQLMESLVASPFLVRQVRELLLRDQEALHRLLQQFSPALRWRVLQTLYPAAELNWPVADRQQLLEEVAPGLRLLRWQALLQVPESSPKTIARMKEAERVRDEEKVEDSTDTTIDSPIFIMNAGLVLLHPFIPRLFRTVGYADGERLVDLNRAVQLLHYLVAGKQPEADRQLVLPKLMCNMPLNRTADFTQIPMEEAKAAADEMLQAAINHWSALKNTSTDGLRSSFLQREGRLVHHKDYWSLRVEQRPFDLLLDHLPWGIGMYRMPWMVERMVVEWV